MKDKLTKYLWATDPNDINVRFEKEIIYFDNIDEDRDWLPEHFVVFETPIKRILKKGSTVYVECEKGNYVLVGLPHPANVRRLDEHHYEIPDWMKAEMNEFLRGGNTDEPRKD